MDVQLAGEAGRFLVGAVLLSAGIAKRGHSAAFEETVRALTPLPPRLARRAARSTPAAEVALGLWLLSGSLPAAAALTATALLAAFGARWSSRSPAATAAPRSGGCGW